MQGPGPALRSPVSLSDWYRLRVGGLICAGILCAVGIIVLMSEYGALDGGENREDSVCSSDRIPPQQVESASASSARSPGEMGSGHAQKVSLVQRGQAWLLCPELSRAWLHANHPQKALVPSSV